MCGSTSKREAPKSRPCTSRKRQAHMINVECSDLACLPAGGETCWGASFN